MVENDSHMAEKIVRFGEGLRDTRQFWSRRRSELTDIIKQLGSQGKLICICRNYMIQCRMVSTNRTGGR